MALDKEQDCTIAVKTEDGNVYIAQAVVVATGSSYRRLGVEGEDDLIGAGVHFCATCDGPFYKGAEELVVVGGGNSGVEEGLFLTNFAKKVTILEFQEKLGASKLLQDKANSSPNVEVHTNTEILELKKTDGGRLASISTKDRKTGEVTEITPEAMFVFIGLDPNTEIFQGVLDLDQRGFIKTTETLMTSIPGVFAAGDVRSGSTKQLASAAGEGAAVLLMVRSYLEKKGDLAVHIG